MELFLPSLIIIVVAAFFAFFIVPRTGPMILAVISILALIAAGIHHYTMFASEYKLSTWQNGIGANAPYFILGLAILFILGAISFMFFGSPEQKEMIQNAIQTPMETVQTVVENSIEKMPAANTATNPITAAINNGLKNVMPNGNSGQGQPSNQRKSPNIPGYGFPASQI
jgi:hypothetical protein